LKNTLSNIIDPLVIILLLFIYANYLESIFDYYSMIPNINAADFLALLIDGIYETDTPAPIAPTNMT
jgi:hypothetical protein